MTPKINWRRVWREYTKWASKNLDKGKGFYVVIEFKRKIESLVEKELKKK